MDILLFITTLRESDRYIETIYLNGGCYQFHLILKTFFSDCVAYINKDKDHVITLHKGNYYDITGIVDVTDYYTSSYQAVFNKESIISSKDISFMFI